MSRALQGRLRFIYPLEAAKARLLMDGSGGTFPGERESGEAVRAAGMAARCWGLQSVGMCVRAIWQSRAGGPLREIEGGNGVNIKRAYVWASRLAARAEEPATSLKYHSIP